jgi:glutathione peroxidase
LTQANPIHKLEVNSIQGEIYTLERYQGQVLLIVNTASQCGFTPQFKMLETLYQTYKDHGLVILGFPCDQFANQEPLDEQGIASFCELNFGVTFPLHEKIHVNGSDTHPLYKHLKQAAKGLLGSQGVKWNFTKFLVDRSGLQVTRFAPKDGQEVLEPAIQALLNQSMDEHRP